jgi:transmembrane sensor
MRIPVWSFLLTIAVIITALLLIPRTRRSGHPIYKLQEKTFTANPGTRSSFLLPDSTQVWLNAGSSLNYKTLPNTDFREADLEGEGYFIVAHSNDHPLRVHSKDLDLNIDSGTTIDLNAYRDDSTTQVSIFGGSAEVRFHNNTSSRVILNREDKLIVPQYNWHIRMDKPMYLPQDSMYEEIAWTKNRLVFFGTSLNDLIPRLQRWYNVKITINDDYLRQARFSAMLTDPGLPKTLKMLQDARSFHYRIDKDQVFITP